MGEKRRPSRTEQFSSPEPAEVQDTRSRRRAGYTSKGANILHRPDTHRRPRQPPPRPREHVRPGPRRSLGQRLLERLRSSSPRSATSNCWLRSSGGTSATSSTSVGRFQNRSLACSITSGRVIGSASLDERYDGVPVGLDSCSDHRWGVLGRPPRRPLSAGTGRVACTHSPSGHGRFHPTSDTSRGPAQGHDAFPPVDGPRRRGKPARASWHAAAAGQRQTPRLAGTMPAETPTQGLATRLDVRPQFRQSRDLVAVR